MTTQNEPPNLFYRGSSMKGTFKPGDRLSIKRAPFNQIRKGDLIIFRKIIDENTEFVVHRVKRITPNGLVTRGDNSRFNDRGVVVKDDIIGRVIRYNRGGKIFPARNGFRGRIHALRLQTRLRCISILKHFLRTPYRLLKKSGVVASIWHPEIKIIQCQTPDGPLIKYMHKNRTIATWRIDTDQRLCRRPYDLIIDSDQVPA